MTRPGDVDVFRPDSQTAAEYARDPADPEVIIDAIEDARLGADVDGFNKIRFETLDQHPYPLPFMKLPGFGERLDDCGDDLPHFCRSCGATFDIGRTCRRSQCPRCCLAWARVRASKICGKLDALRRYKYASQCGPGPQQPDNMFFHHLVLSPPDDWRVDDASSPQEAFEKTIDVLKEILDELGLEGVIFYHPARGVESDDRGFWKKVIGSDLTWSEIKDQIEHSPHFHVVGVAPFVDGAGVTEVVEDATDWVIKRITQSENSTKSITDDFSLARAVTYAISHTGLYETEQTTQAAYRYFGSDMNMVTAYEDRQLAIDAIVRAVAPRTLGIPYRELACESDVTERAEYRVDLGRAIGKTKVGVRPDDGATSSATSTSSSSSSDSSSGAETLEVTRDNPELVDCQGALLPIHEAPDFLDDDDWLESAEHGEQLRETFDEWISKPAQRDQLERWIEKQREGWLEDQLPPPDD